MASKVYFADFKSRSQQENKQAKIQALFDAAGFGRLTRKGRLCAVKLHFGEPGTDAFLHPVLVRAVTDKIRRGGGKPFLTDTNTLYAGKRHNAVDHLETAARHGFTPSVVNAPVMIADGLEGENFTVVPLPPGTSHFKEAKIAGAIARADSMIVLSHFKGHQMAGFGGAIKNLAMGCAPGAGKCEQHSPRFEVDKDVCVGCGECVSICPEQAPALAEGKAEIDKSLCVGCGECYAHCPEKAIQLDWKTEIPKFMERMTEYALGAVQGKKGRVGYINFLMNITPDCDCLPWSDRPIVPDIGILASTDPVAVDQAGLDLVAGQAALPGTHLETNLAPGMDKFAGLWPHTQGAIQLTHGQKIGLGSVKYELVRI